MIVQFLIDNQNSWIIPHAIKLKKEIIKEFNFTVKLIYNHNDVIKGDILFLLSCIKIFKNLDLNKHNLLIHESALPKGRGMSPFTWQIIEGKSEIPVTLIGVSPELDSGKIYDQKIILLNGSELIDDWRILQFEATAKLIKDFLFKYPNVNGVEQEGTPTFYRPRNVNDSKLDILKSINEQFNLLRVSDNKRYPAWFEKNGNKYKLEISKIE